MNELYHYGILGMRWGVRRFQNKDGSYTAAGKKRYSNDSDTDETGENTKERSFWTDERRATAKKVAIGVGAVAATAVVAYSAYKIGKHFIDSSSSSAMSKPLSDPDVKDKLLKMTKNGADPLDPTRPLDHDIRMAPIERAPIERARIEKAPIERFEPERFEPERFEPERFEPERFTWERHTALRSDGKTDSFDFPVMEQRRDYADHFAKVMSGKSSGRDYDDAYNYMLRQYRLHGIDY